MVQHGAVAFLKTALFTFSFSTCPHFVFRVCLLGLSLSQQTLSIGLCSAANSQDSHISEPLTST